MNELFRRLREAIDIPSPSGEESAFTDYVTRLLEERGYASVERQRVETGRENVWARADGDPRVVLCTHLDCVPPWIGSSEDDAAIYGRGSCDAKGILVAMLEAADRLRAGGAVGLGLLFTVGEETNSDGARAARALSPGSRFVVVGEPTQGRLASGHKGVFRFTLRAEGTAAHSAYPELGISAVDRLLDALDAIRRADWGRSERLGPATVNVGTLQGGVAANVIPPSAEAQVLVRVAGRAEVARAVLDGLLAERPGLSYETTAWTDAVHCHTREGWEVEAVRFGTDIPYLGPGFGTPLLIGPGSIHDAHTAGEKILKRELQEAVQMYERLVGELLREAE